MSLDPRALSRAQTQALVLDADVEFIEQRLTQPFVLSSGTIEVLTEARATVRVRTGRGEATGHGSIYLSDLWAWPDPELSHEVRDRALRRCCRNIADSLPRLVGGEAAHPLELGLRLHDAVCHPQGAGVADELPPLAQAMCLSPFDAAIHDAVGRSLGLSAMRLYEGEASATSADRWFDGRGAFAAIADVITPTPRDRFPAWWIVGKNDDLERDVRPQFDRRGYHCFKLKLHGRDVAEDVSRTHETCEAALGWGCQPRLSVDTNEACADAAFVLDYLERLRRDHPTTFERLEYLEQPTARDIAANPEDWRDVTPLKPVLLDEGLTSLDRLPLALEQGWSGLALKTCKGHSFALVAAAWAKQNGLIVALQDLTNPGISAVHAALFAAYVPTINGAELNSPQFTPSANARCMADWPGLFEVKDGQHRLDHLAPAGLGSVVDRAG